MIQSETKLTKSVYVRFIYSINSLTNFDEIRYEKLRTKAPEKWYMAFMISGILNYRMAAITSGYK